MWWAQHGIRPFEGSVDDWPAARADRLKAVWLLADQTVHDHSPHKKAAGDALVAEAKRKAGQL